MYQIDKRDTHHRKNSVTVYLSSFGDLSTSKIETVGVVSPSEVEVSWSGISSLLSTIFIHIAPLPCQLNRWVRLVELTLILALFLDSKVLDDMEFIFGRALGVSCAIGTCSSVSKKSFGSGRLLIRPALSRISWASLYFPFEMSQGRDSGMNLQLERVYYVHAIFISMLLLLILSKIDNHSADLYILYVHSLYIYTSNIIVIGYLWNNPSATLYQVTIEVTVTLS